LGEWNFDDIFKKLVNDDNSVLKILYWLEIRPFNSL